MQKSQPHKLFLFVLYQTSELLARPANIIYFFFAEICFNKFVSFPNYFGVLLTNLEHTNIV